MPAPHPARPETKELFSSHIPALQVLLAMGHQYLPPEEALKKRGGSNREVLLHDVLIEELKKRRFTWKGQDYPLSMNAIDEIVRQLASPGLGEGLLTANERIYDRLTLGITVTEFIDGKRAQPTIPLINWEHPENNQFHVTDEFEVMNASGTGTRRPDIVCFLNGIPLVVIEAKRPDPHNPRKDMIKEGISQSLRNQGVSEIPHLFAYSQLLLAVNGLDGRYGTTRTPAKFWALWRDEDFEEAVFHQIKNTGLSSAQKQSLFSHRPQPVRDYFEQQRQGGSLLPSGQDRLIISLLRPDRLLEFIRFFILFDKKNGKIAARYQQFFGIKRLIERVSSKNRRGARARQPECRNPSPDLIVLVDEGHRGHGGETHERMRQE